MTLAVVRKVGIRFLAVWVAAVALIALVVPSAYADNVNQQNGGGYQVQFACSGMHVITEQDGITSLTVTGLIGSNTFTLTCDAGTPLAQTTFTPQGKPVLSNISIVGSGGLWPFVCGWSSESVVLSQPFWGQCGFGVGVTPDCFAVSLEIKAIYNQSPGWPYYDGSLFPCGTS